MHFLYRYTSILHKRDKGNEPNPERFAKYNPNNIKKVQWNDGLNTVKYQVSSIGHSLSKTTTIVTLEKVLCLKNSRSKQFITVVEHILQRTNAKETLKTPQRLSVGIFV